ncbi:MAG: DUF1707 SHOCT-like domain-containing protein [Acidimicrobiales bacterium]
MRASHSDRSRVENELRLAFQEGRIQLDELDQRLTLTNESKTYEDLFRCVGDIPGGSDLIYQMSAAAQRTSVAPGVDHGFVAQSYYRRRRSFRPIGIALAVFFAFNLLSSAFMGGYGDGPGPFFNPLPFLLLFGGGMYLFRRLVRR